MEVTWYSKHSSIQNDHFHKTTQTIRCPTFCGMKKKKIERKYLNKDIVGEPWILEISVAC
jgi:hypothetical protein